MELSYQQIFFRLALAAVSAGAIGYEREYKNRPAGVRTHILLCLGAAIIALIQEQIMIDTLNFSFENPSLISVLRSDPARLVAQVVSGVGFLGAGTIVFTKKNVVGLTTAASLWTVACLGIAIGMGYYTIAISGSCFVLFVLYVLKKIIQVPQLKKIELQFEHRIETKEFITSYFEKNRISIRDVSFNMDNSGEKQLYKNVYTIELPEGYLYTNIVEDLSLNSNVKKNSLISV